MEAERRRVQVDGREVELTHLDRVVYRATGTTKAALIEYHAAVAQALLTQLADRPVTFHRFPDGAGEPGFWQKHCPADRPEWLRTVAVAGAEGASIAHCMIEERGSLVWAVNRGVLEFHVPLHTLTHPDRPTWMILDLDPGEGRGILDCAALALELRARLEVLGLESFVKTTGSKGLHLHVPLGGNATYEESAGLARYLAEELERRAPERAISRMRRALRRGRVFIDWSQNHARKTNVAAYSLRAGEEPLVATPVGWEEVAGALRADDPARLRFTPDDVRRRLERHGDLLAVPELEPQVLTARFSGAS